MRTASGSELDFKKLLALAVVVVLGVVFWDSPALWPLKMLVVMIHETGHATASLLVGGSVTRVTIASDQSGMCLSTIPAGFLAKVVVYSAGYVGSAMVGGLLLILTLRFRGGRWILFSACVWLVVMALVYAGNAFTLFFCLATALALGVGARLLPNGAVDLLNLVLASFCALYAVMDLKDDLWNSAVRDRSDAALLSNLTYIPAVVWAGLWSLFSLMVVGLCIWTAVRGAKRRAPALNSTASARA